MKIRNIELEYKKEDFNGFYLGQLRDRGVKQGLGLKIKNDKERYHGEWKNNLYNGIGYFSSDTKNLVYIGEFLNGIYNGIGKLNRLKLKSSYVGEFRNSKKHGFGSKENQTEVISGRFVDGKLEGYSEFFSKNSGKKIYKGEIKNGIYEGIGMKIIDSSKTYFGQFKFGSMNGIGVLKFKSSSNKNFFSSFSSRISQKSQDSSQDEYYFGSWIKGRREGFAIQKLLTPSKVYYEGTFIDSDYNGFGKLTNSDNLSVYVGEIKNGKKNGFGRLKGEKYYYLGNWKMGQRRGLGFYKGGNGNYFGMWKGNKRHGVGISMSDGVEYRAEWKDDRTFGVFVIKGKNGEFVTALMGSDGKMKRVNASASELNQKVKSLDLENFLKTAKKKIGGVEVEIEENKSVLLEKFGILQLEFDNYQKELDKKLSIIESNYKKLKYRTNINYQIILFSMRKMDYQIPKILRNSFDPYEKDIGNDPTLDTDRIIKLLDEDEQDENKGDISISTARSTIDRRKRNNNENIFNTTTSRRRTPDTIRYQASPALNEFSKEDGFETDRKRTIDQLKVPQSVLRSQRRRNNSRIKQRRIGSRSRSPFGEKDKRNRTPGKYFSRAKSPLRSFKNELDDEAEDMLTPTKDYSYLNYKEYDELRKIFKRKYREFCEIENEKIKLGKEVKRFNNLEKSKKIYENWRKRIDKFEEDLDTEEIKLKRLKKKLKKEKEDLNENERDILKMKNERESLEEAYNTRKRKHEEEKREVKKFCPDFLEIDFNNKVKEKEIQNFKENTEENKQEKENAIETRKELQEKETKLSEEIEKIKSNMDSTLLKLVEEKDKSYYEKKKVAAEVFDLLNENNKIKQETANLRNELNKENTIGVDLEIAQNELIEVIKDLRKFNARKKKLKEELTELKEDYENNILTQRQQNVRLNRMKANLLVKKPKILKEKYLRIDQKEILKKKKKLLKKERKVLEKRLKLKKKKLELKKKLFDKFQGKKKTVDIPEIDKQELIKAEKFRNEHLIPSVENYKNLKKEIEEKKPSKENEFEEFKPKIKTVKSAKEDREDEYLLMLLGIHKPRYRFTSSNLEEKNLENKIKRIKELKTEIEKYNLKKQEEEAEKNAKEENKKEEEANKKKEEEEAKGKEEIKEKKVIPKTSKLSRLKRAKSKMNNIVSMVGTLREMGIKVKAEDVLKLDVKQINDLKLIGKRMKHKSLMRAKKKKINERKKKSNKKRLKLEYKIKGLKKHLENLAMFRQKIEILNLQGEKEEKIDFDKLKNIRNEYDDEYKDYFEGEPTIGEEFTLEGVQALTLDTYHRNRLICSYYEKLGFFDISKNQLSEKFSQNYNWIQDVKVNEHGDIFVLKGKENTLLQLDKSLKLLKTYKSLETEEKISEESEELKKQINLSSECSTYTGNDYNYLWSKGQNCLAVHKFNSEKDHEVKDFWLYLQKKRNLIPIFLLGDKKGNKLFGVGMDETSNEKILVFHKNEGERTCIPFSTYGENLDEVHAGEVSRAGKVLFWVGNYEDKATVVAVEFKSGLKILSNYVLSPNNKTARSVSRVLGSNSLLIGSLKAVYVVEFKSREEGFRRINKFETLPGGNISSLFFFTNSIFCFSKEDGKFFKISFEREMDYLSFYYIEHLWHIKKKKSELNNLTGIDDQQEEEE